MSHRACPSYRGSTKNRLPGEGGGIVGQARKGYPEDRTSRLPVLPHPTHPTAIPTQESVLPDSPRTLSRP